MSETVTGILFPNISPEIFSISLFGMEFALRWYALAYIVGLLIAWWLAVRAVKATRLWANETPPMTPAQIEDFMTYAILGVILGGRIGYVLFYNPAILSGDPLAILRIWEGGMSFHGGFLGVILASFLYFRAHRIPLSQGADLVALVVAPGLLLGRLANFINAELWGRATDIPWGVIFPGEAAQDCPEVIGLCARHPSQLYEAAMEGILLGGVLLYLAWRRGALKTPWRITAVFFMGYGMARFIVEFFRQPDAQFQSVGNPLGLAFHYGGYGVTMGQTLSLPMIAIGMILLFWGRRKHGS
jgi:phosphatidylglycerol:prolipoprotein diacylglycerol transferase